MKSLFESLFLENLTHHELKQGINGIYTLKIEIKSNFNVIYSFTIAGKSNNILTRIFQQKTKWNKIINALNTLPVEILYYYNHPSTFKHKEHNSIIKYVHSLFPILTSQEFDLLWDELLPLKEKDQNTWHVTFDLINTKKVNPGQETVRAESDIHSILHKDENFPHFHSGS